MKPLLIILLFMGTFLSNLQAQHKVKPIVCGQTFNSKNAITVAELPKVLNKQDSVFATVTGKVQQVCQAKGCWMDVVLADNSVMKVRFKDYGFFVPKNIAGKTVTLNGMAYTKTISVKEQQHYALDAGQSKEQINAITQPKSSITFTAAGVMLHE